MFCTFIAFRFAGILLARSHSYCCKFFIKFVPELFVIMPNKSTVLQVPR